jgi:hypothetical protein
MPAAENRHLPKRLADLTRLPSPRLTRSSLSPVAAKFRTTRYVKAHADLPGQDEWIIDGFELCRFCPGAVP